MGRIFKISTLLFIAINIGVIAYALLLKPIEDRLDPFVNEIYVKVELLVIPSVITAYVLIIRIKNASFRNCVITISLCFYIFYTIIMVGNILSPRFNLGINF